MQSINSNKKIQKLNKFMKVSDRDVYYRMFQSKALNMAYNYFDIEKDIKKMVKTYFHEECEIFYLGSRVIGLSYSEESDLDLFIDIGKRYYRDRDYEKDVETVEYLKEIFNEISIEWTFKKINFSVPSIKAVHRKTGIKCDISVTNGLAVHNSKLLGHLFQIQPEAVALFHYIKKWLQLFDVRFKGFTLTLLIIFFLQQRNLMPAIKDVQRYVYPEVFIDDYAVQFDDNRDRDYYGIEEMKYFKDHVKGFFDFYAKFSFSLNIICPYSGVPQDKDSFFERIDMDCPMTISAPLLRRTNCSKYVNSIQLAEFVETCWFSSEYLAEYQPPKEMNDYEFYYEDKYYKRYNDYGF